MIIERTSIPGATLPEDRDGLLIDGRDTLILSRADCAIRVVGPHERLTLSNLTIVRVGRMSRLRRFIVFARAAWAFSKVEEASA